MTKLSQYFSDHSSSCIQASKLLDKHPDTIYILSFDGDVLYFNKPLDHLLGLPTQRKNLRKVLEKEHYQQLLLLLSGCIDGHTSSATFHIKNDPLSGIHLTCMTIPISNKTENLAAYVIFQNTTELRITTDKLVKRETILKEIRGQIDLLYFECDYQTGLIKGCEQFTKTFQQTVKKRDHFQLQDFTKMIYEKDIQPFNKMFYQSMASKEQASMELRIRIPSLPLQYFKATFKPMTIDGNTTLLGILQNITYQKKLELQLSFEEKHLNFMYDHLDGITWCLDYLTGKPVYVSEGTEQVYGITKEEFMKNPELWFERVHPEDVQTVMAYQKRLEQGESVNYEYRVLHENGQYVWLDAQAVPRQNLEGEIIQLFGFARDITELKSIQAIKEFNANFDPLTHVYNRHHFYETIQKKTADPTNPFSLIYLDIKRFTTLNEILGFMVGDKILKNLSTRLMEKVGHHYIARMTGSLFAIMVHYREADEVYQLLRELMEDMDPNYQIGEFEFHLELNAGVSFFPSDHQASDEIIRYAGIALQRSKEFENPNYQVYYNLHDLISHKRYELEKDLRLAIQNREMKLYYQPRVRPKDHKIMGVEALIRWQHPVWGTVRPNEFISLAEENYLITDITAFVVEEACRQQREWHDEGFQELVISVNVSPLNFNEVGFVSHVKKCLQKYHVKGSQLEIEITETTLIKNETTTLHVLKQLKDLGVRIAFDDFGAGYSSLSYVKNFPLDTIKINKSFVAQVEEQDEALQKKAKHLLSSMIYLAKGMDMNVVVEGIETPSQLSYIVQKECDEVQGYLFAKPAPPLALHGHLKQGVIHPPKLSLKPKLERRQFYRFAFDMPLQGKMKILEVKGKKVQAGNSMILIKDISIGGLKFVSSLNIPVRPDVKMEFDLVLLGFQITVEGRIVWKNEMKYETYDYGVQFITDESTENELAEVVNKLSILKRNQKEFEQTPIVYEDPYMFIHKLTR